jgi:hypothetical protein
LFGLILTFPLIAVHHSLCDPTTTFFAQLTSEQPLLRAGCLLKGRRKLVYPTKKVQALLRDYGLKFLSRGDGTAHEVWGNANGMKVKLAPRGNMVPVQFLHKTALQLQAAGIRNFREFKADLRGICTD